MLFLRDRDERDYVEMLKTFIVDYTNGTRRLPRFLSDCRFNAFYYSFPFLAQSSVCREAAKCEARHRASSEKTNIVGCHNREIFYILRSLPRCMSMSSAGGGDTSLCGVYLYRQVHVFHMCRACSLATRHKRKRYTVPLVVMFMSWLSCCFFKTLPHRLILSG